MKSLILIGRSEAGKTTLSQALHREQLRYAKTQFVHYDDWMIDTPGEYIQTRVFGGAVALYTYEADMVGLLIAATEPYSLYSPNVTCMANREVIGIVTKIDEAGADPDRAERWLRLTGCRKIFRVSAVTGEGLPALQAYLQKQSILPAKTEKHG